MIETQSQPSVQEDHRTSVETINVLLPQIIENNTDEQTKNGLELLLKLVSNILQKPTESKYRTIKSTIPKIKNTIFTLKGGIQDLILALGFTSKDEEHFVFIGDCFKVLREGTKMANKAIEPIRVKLMTPEERSKYELLQEQKRLHVAEQAKKRAFVDELKRLSEYDRKEKATQEVIAPKTNNDLNRAEKFQAIYGKTNDPYSICKICFEDCTKFNVCWWLKCCYQGFHAECLKNYLEVTLSDSKHEIVCPNNECREIWSEEELKDIVTKDMYHKYELTTLKVAIGGATDLNWCPTEGCKYAFIFDPNDENACKDLTCPSCSESYCIECMILTSSHSGRTCEQVRQDRLESARMAEIGADPERAEQAFNEAVQREKFQQCSKCLAVIEKNEGCNHMTCKCKHHFCYLCGGDWEVCKGDAKKCKKPVEVQQQ